MQNNLAPLSAIVAAASGGKLPKTYEACVSREQRRAWASAYRSRRPKQFGTSYGQSLGREERTALFVGGVSLLRASGRATANCYSVLRVLLFDFINLKTGECFPSHDTIAKKADCRTSTVKLALALLEELGILTWTNRLVWQFIEGMKRPRRGSNCYRFLSWFAAKLKPAYKAEKRLETDSKPFSLEEQVSGIDPDVARRLISLGETLSKSAT